MHRSFFARHLSSASRSNSSAPRHQVKRIIRLRTEQAVRIAIIILVISQAEYMADSGDIRIGISGWRYGPWRGVFYPEKMPQRRELAFAGETFRAVEINGTFYSLQRP